MKTGTSRRRQCEPYYWEIILEGITFQCNATKIAGFPSLIAYILSIFLSKITDCTERGDVRVKAEGSLIYFRGDVLYLYTLLQ